MQESNTFGEFNALSLFSLELLLNTIHNFQMHLELVLVWAKDETTTIVYTINAHKKCSNVFFWWGMEILFNS
jgi:hypothetical protein